MATPRTPKVPYPVKNDFKTFYIYKEGKCVFKGNKQELFKSPFSENCHSIAAIRDKFIMEEVVDTDGFKKVMKAYNDEQKEIHEALQNGETVTFDFEGMSQFVLYMLEQRSQEELHGKGV